MSTNGRSVRSGEVCTRGLKTASWLTALALTNFTLTHQALAQEVVAELALDAPEAEEFILHGTIPVPAGTLLDGARISPLTVLQPNGEPALTQAEIATRYAKSDSGADVLELIARVRRPAGATVGERVAYSVVRSPQAPAQLELHDEVAALLGTDGAFKIVSRDVFGHRYEADLGQAFRKPAPRVRRNGSLVRELIAHRVMLPNAPVAGDQGTLPHLAGVHAWLRVFDREGYALLDLQVHNGLDGRDEGDADDDLLDKLYFGDLGLRLPPGWKVISAFGNPAAGPNRPAGGLVDHMLLADRPDAVYLLPRQGRMVRRVALALPGYEEIARAAIEERGLAFSRRGTNEAGQDLWSWWNPETARYFPQRHRLPELDHIGLSEQRAKLAAKLSKYEAQLAAGAPGTYPFYSKLLGWAQPWGVAYGGMTGGDEIHPWDGLRTAAASSREGFRLAQLIARAYSDRQPTALYDKHGTHTQVADILEDGPNGPYAVCNFYIRPSSGFGFEDAPTFQTKAVRSLGQAARWHDVIDAWKPIDLQHYVRYTRNLKILCWLGNDSLAQHLLVASAEVYHLSFHRYSVGKWSWVPGTGLLARQHRVREDPGEGVDLGRADAWGLDGAAAAYSVAEPGWRQQKLDWFEAIADVVEEGQSNCTGNLQAIHIGKLLGGRYLVRRANESGYLEHALVGMNESVFRGEHPQRAAILDQVVIASVRAGIQAPFWSQQSQGVWWTVGVSGKDPALPEYCQDIPHSGFEGGTTNQHSWSSLAYAYALTGESIFLQRASEMSGGKLWEDMHAGGEDWLESRAAMLALVQSLAGH